MLLLQLLSLFGLSGGSKGLAGKTPLLYTQVKRLESRCKDPHILHSVWINAIYGCLQTFPQTFIKLA